MDDRFFMEITDCSSDLKQNSSDFIDLRDLRGDALIDLSLDSALLGHMLHHLLLQLTPKSSFLHVLNEEIKIAGVNRTSEPFD